MRARRTSLDMVARQVDSDFSNPGFKTELTQFQTQTEGTHDVFTRPGLPGVKNRDRDNCTLKLRGVT
jgi:hypothetical protein